MFKRNIMIVVIFGAAFVAFGSSANAQSGVYLGSLTFKDRAEYDLFEWIRKDHFSRVQFRVSGAAVDFRRVVVVFGNGESRDLKIRQRIAAGGKTRWIDLRGGSSNIKTIKFWFKPASVRKKKGSRVSVYALR